MCIKRTCPQSPFLPFQPLHHRGQDQRAVKGPQGQNSVKMSRPKSLPHTLLQTTRNILLPYFPKRVSPLKKVIKSPNTKSCFACGSNTLHLLTYKSIYKFYVMLAFISGKKKQKQKKQQQQEIDI